MSKRIFFVVACFSIFSLSNFAFSAPKTLPFTQSFDNCTASNGLGASGGNPPAGTPGLSIFNRVGNNGNGNGGEAFNVYNTVVNGDLVHQHFECFTTSDEGNESGTRYVSFNGGPFIPTGPTGPLDPRKNPNSNGN